MAKKKQLSIKKRSPVTKRSPGQIHASATNGLTHGNSSKINRMIIRNMGVDPELNTLLEEEKLATWKKFQTPALMLMDEYINFKALVNAKQLQGEDPTGKEIRECLKLLLDISKEVNRLTAVSANKKFEAYTNNLGFDKDYTINVTPDEKD